MLALLLLLASEQLTGIVQGPDLRPVPGAEIVLRDGAGRVVAAGQSDGGGRVAVDAPRGAYRATVRRAGFASYEELVRVPREEWRITLALSPAHAEITVSAEAGSAAALDAVPQRVNVIRREEIEERVVFGLSEAANGEAGLAAQQTTGAMGSFFVRGLTGKNVAVYRDGVRFSTSLQRGGISTFFNLADPASVERVEVLRGPNSAQYGSDSLGGAVSIEAPAPSPGSAGWSGELSLLGSSAVAGGGLSSRVEYSGSRGGVLATMGARRHNTLRSGAGLDSHAAVTRFLGLPSTRFGTRQPDTAFTSYGGAAHGLLRVDREGQLAVRYERAQQDGVQRSDQLLGGDGNLIAAVRNLMVDFGYARYRHGGRLPWSGSVSFNRQREERVNQGGAGNPRAPIAHQYERATVWGAQWQASGSLGAHRLLAGAEGYRERVAAPAFTVDPVANTSMPSRPRVPDGALYWSHGVFVQDSWELHSRLRLAGALRFGGASYQAPGDSLTANGWTGRAGAVGKLTEQFAARAYYGRGFRVPSVTDLGTLGLQGNGFYEASPAAVFGRGGMVGDRADAQAQSTGRPVAPLRPETSDNIEAGLTWNSPRLRIDLAGFRTWLGNSIVSQTLLLPAGAVGQPLGDQIISAQLPSGAIFVPVAPNPVLVRANYGGVRLDGVEHELRWRWSRAWAWRHNFTWIEARDRATGRPPDLEPGIPPPTFHAALLWSPPDRSWWFEPYLTIADEQRRLSSLALADRRIGATRSRANIASFFNNGAIARGWVANGRLLATGESLAEVQQRVLGPANSSPLFSRIPGYCIVGLRGGWTLRARHQFLVDLANLTDRNWRGIGWGVDAPGFGVSLRYRVFF